MIPPVEARKQRLPGCDGHLHGPAPAPRPPLGEDTFARVQQSQSQPFPASLVEVWSQVGNGGFGPG